MADLTVKRIEEMESIWGGSFVRARFSRRKFVRDEHLEQPAQLGELGAQPRRPTCLRRQEEVYTALSGSATLHVAGEEHLLAPGVFARVGAAEKRKLSTGAEGAQILCIGGMPGRVYEPLPIVQLGGPESI